MKRRMFALLALLIGCQGMSPPDTAVAGEAVLLEFSSPQCGPCRAMQPVLAELEREGVPIRHVDLSTEPHLGTRYGVRKTPTFVIVAGGQELTRLVGMRSADELRAALATDPSGPRIPTGSFQPTSSPQNTPQTSLAAINAPANRAVPMSSPAVSGLTPTGIAPTSIGAARPSTPSHEAMPSLSVAEAVQRAQAATVRLRVHDGQGYGVGTGTIIDTHGDEALVLTCGHLFRETQGKGEIEVELFIGGETKSVPGQVVDYDADKRDIALVAIRPGFPVQPVELITPQDQVQAGQAVFSFGCDRGADPSRRDTRITGVNKYNQHLGLSNLEIAGAPIDGRSGGGLFDQQGRLIGVCNAADYEGDVGIYTGPGSVHWQLERVNLTHLYQPAERLASLSGATLPAASSAPDQPAANSPSPPETNANLPTAQTGNNREAGNDREVIVIIRDRQRPESGSRMIELNQPSDDLIRMLESQARR